MTDGKDGRMTTPEPTRDDSSRADAMFSERHGGDLIDLAVRSIEHGLAKGRPLQIAADTFAPELRAERASFVTLEHDHRLRGCIGSVIASRPLVEDIVENAFRAAFRDPRFPPLSGAERDGLGVSISLLSPMGRVPADSETVLCDALRPGVDGLMIEDEGRRAVFLPQVWEQLPEPGDFLRHLRQKAGLPPAHWSATFRAWRFSVSKVPAAGLHRMPPEKAEASAQRAD